jgi:hypothetical protein
VALVAWPVFAPLSAQVAVGGGITLESYTFDVPENTSFEKLTLMTLPFQASIDLTDDLNVSVGGAFAEGEMTLEDESTLTISGLTDTSIRASYTLGQDRVVLSGAVFLPTGKVNLTAEEARVAGAVAYDLLPTHVTNWGTGGGADVSIAFALPAGAVSLGARVGYRLVSEYEPYDEGVEPFGDIGGGEVFVYDPGDQFYVRAALDANLSDASKFTLTGTFQSFSDDATEGTNIFRSGSRMQGMASLIFPAGASGSAWLYGGVLHRGEGEFLELVEGEVRTSQNVFFGGAGARVLIGGVGLVPVVEARGLKTDDGFGQGWTLGAGGSLEIPLGDGPALVPTAKFRLGRVLVSDLVESDFTGFEIGASLRGIGR